MIEEKEEFKDGKIKLVFDSNNPFVKMAVEIFHQFLIDEASGALNATTTLWSNAKLLQRTFTEERQSMVIHNKKHIPVFGSAHYEMFKVIISNPTIKKELK